ncbi:putative HTH transcriptional regulator [Dyadobacter jejuensis]|uniref:Putative HTH transcriptional regulator n=1 Tax=Dyadobacter jejuensis TaxID=1082580 RepID=A0A316ABW7_9BACT|nr:RNA-binding domain-containing protein [Dyadobacter jejuensis]PWJ54758.1 putative HTH transcriptional regulator [Dyadobacter jejuensis]
MEKLTRHSIQWFYNLLAKGECDILDFKEQLEDKIAFGKSLKNFAPKYEELAKDVVAFANKKGGFLFIGIEDKTKEINSEFEFTDAKVFELIRQIQDRTVPSITLKPHSLVIQNKKVLVLEVPFSPQLHRTSKSEYLVRSNDGNRSIETYEIATIQAEKGLIVFDQKTWDLPLESQETDKQGNPIPGWQDISKTRDLFLRIQKEKPQSPYLKNNSAEFTETLGLIKEENGKLLPTTSGILFIGNQKAFRELPYNQIKYIRYYEDGSYTPFEYSGNLIEMADSCFGQLKSEIKLKEFHFGLFREYIEDYPEVVLRELLINALAHRDYSRQQIIEIRKYPNYLEFESPGHFPQGINETNFLRKTNPRNPGIMDVLREINYAEKAGSGFDKIFTALLSKGKKLPEPIQTEHSILLRINADVYSEKLAELSLLYKQTAKKDIDLEKLIVLNHIYTGQKLTFQQLEQLPFVNNYQLRKILSELQDIEFIETTGRTSGLKYIIHKTKLASTDDKIGYTKLKKQEKARQIEAIIRYLDTMDEIDNEAARKLLNIPDTNASYVSRLFSEMIEKGQIEIAEETKHNQRTYKLKQ